MTLRFIGLLHLFLVLVLNPAPAGAQGTGPGGLPPGTVGIPRARDGRPDLSGIWPALNTAHSDIEAHASAPGPIQQLGASGAIPGGLGVVEGEIPYKPEALAKKKENFANRLALDPEMRCYLPGVPRITYMPFPFQILQFADRVAILYEYLHTTREIYTDGSPHTNLAAEFWMGDSRGRWDKDTLVVDVTHFTDQTWFDRAGNFHSGELHVIERYTRTGPDHMRYEATIEDPKVFTRPWKMSMPLYRRQEMNTQLLEYECYAYAREEAK